MDLIDLKIFKELYFRHNITEVSKNLYMSQPTVSYRLNKMHDELNVTLYEYDGGYKFTEEALQFYNFCNETLTNYEQMTSSLKAKQQIVINLSSVASWIYLPSVYSVLQAQGYVPIINISSSDTAISGLLEKRALAAIVGGIKIELSKEVERIELKEERIVLALNETVEDDITKIDLLIDEKRSGLHSTVLDYVKNQGEPRIVGEIGSSVEKLFLVERFPLGVFIPERYLNMVNYDTLKIKISKKYFFSRKIFILFHKQDSKRKVIKELIEKLNEA
jgi:DNA-binding transcriptional LysR family regulator